MKSLYFLLPTVEKATKAVQAIKSKGVSDDYIALVANDKHVLDKVHVQEPDILHNSDVIPALERGSLVGAGAGLLAGLAAVALAPEGLVIAGGAMLGLTLFGGGFGAWASSMIGVSVTKPEIEKFQQAIEKGELLLIVDVTIENESEIKSAVKTAINLVPNFEAAR